MSFDLTPAQVAAGFTLLGQRPVSGDFSTLPPVDAKRAIALLDGTGLSNGSNLTPSGTAIFTVLAAPGRKISSTVVPGSATGAITSTFYAPAEGGPYVAAATSEVEITLLPPEAASPTEIPEESRKQPEGLPLDRGSQTAEPFGGGYRYHLALIKSGAEVSALITAYLGLGDKPEPLEGDAVELTAGAFAALAALADLDEESSHPGSVRRALGRNPELVVNAFRTIAPTGASDSGQAGVRDAGNWLVGAGLVVRHHDNRLQPTAQGRAVLRALREFTAAGSVTVDHLSDAGPVRAALISSIRTPERLLFGAWKVTGNGPMITLGEPGSTTAATTLRTLIETPSVLPVAASVPATAKVSTQLLAEEPEPAPNPQWVPALMYGGVILALAGAAFGLTGGDDNSGFALPASEPTTTTEVVTTTAAPTTTTTTIAVTTEATPQTVPPAVLETTTTSSTTTTSTTSTTTTTTTTLPPPLLEDTFDGPATPSSVFGPGSVEIEVNADAQLRITALVSGVIPSTYPDPLPAQAEVTFDFFPQPVSPDGFSGVIVLADDPSDGVLDHYVLVLTTQDNRNLTFLVWNAGWGDPAPTTIPESAGYAINQWNTMRLVLNDGAVDAYVNDVYVSSLTDPAPTTTGYWGPTIIGSATPGETMLVDNVLVVG